MACLPSAIRLPSLRLRTIALVCLGVLTCVPATVQAQVNVLTNRYDPQRTGANLVEKTLTATNVNPTRFGKLYSLPVDGAVYAQPLYVSGISINGVVRNVLYVATMNDKVYAFDADRASSAALWVRDFTSPPAITPVPIADIVGDGLNIVGNVGIQSTPVIDRASNTLYLVARTKESGTYVQRLHALDLVTGASRTGSPVTITGTARGNAQDATMTPDGPVITFNPRVQVQRAALALVNGVVLVSWASHEDIRPSHGWIMGFNSATLARVGVFATAPDGYLGGVWQGGRAPTIDATGHAYFATGNGPWDGIRNFGNSLLKLRVSRTELALVDYFTPSNYEALNSADDDLSGSGFTLLPGTSLLVGGGKEGVLYVVDSTKLGHLVANDTQIVQKVAVNGGHVMGGVVYWNSGAAGPLVYNWSEEDVLKAYRLSSGKLVTTPFARGQPLSPGHPGGSLTLSANGSLSGTGVVWASMPWQQDAMHGLAAGILRAFNADTLQEIWNSEQNSSRDRLGNLMKFVPPVVANGKVFLPNHDNAIAVYGVLPADFTVSATPTSRTVAPGSSATYSVTVTAHGAFTGRVDLRATGQPSGSTVTFSPAFVSGSGTSTMTIAVPSTTALGTFAITVSGTDGARTRSAGLVSLVVSSSPGGGGAVGIDFTGSGVAMSAAEVAGVVPQANWNNASGAARSTPLALKDQAGTSAGAAVTWNSNGAWATPITDAPGNGRLMKGYLDTSSTSATKVTVTGLASRAYDVYVYVDGDNRTYARSAVVSISGTGITTKSVTITDAAGANYAGTFTEAGGGSGNYVKFAITGTGFTVTATPGAATSATQRAPVNAIQIVPVTSAARRAISVDFVGSSTSLLGTTESAGAVPRAHWNNAAGAARSTPLSLVDEIGATTPATITWSASGAWSLPVTADTPNRRMMKGYLDTTSTSVTTVSVAGLVSGTYDVLVYADGDNRAYSRSASYAISGSGFTSATRTLTDAASTNFSTAFVEANGSSGNYVRFRISGSGFTVRASPTGSVGSTLRAPINAIQIVPVATP